MFPLKLCGTWCLIYTTNRSFIENAELQINYKKVRFASKYETYNIEITKNIYGVIRADETTAKIIWIKKIDYEIDTRILPIIKMPYKNEKLCKSEIKYTLDDTLNINDGLHEYIFIRSIIEKKNDTLIRVFITQLILDYIIRHIYRII